MESFMEGPKNAVGIIAVMGMLIGVVVSSMTGEWWWIGMGLAIGISIEAVRRSRAGGS
jgi:hypothetical protein